MFLTIITSILYVSLVVLVLAITLGVVIFLLNAATEYFDGLDLKEWAKLKFVWHGKAPRSVEGNSYICRLCDYSTPANNSTVSYKYCPNCGVKFK